jgi:primosomal protein N' (replication factor Y)
MQALQRRDRDAFLAAEAEGRQMAGLPPYGRLAAVILSSVDGEVLERYARALAAEAPNGEGVEVYGPADAPLALVRGRRRKRFLVRADRNVDIQAYLTTWRARAKPPSAVRMDIDVDPYSFL